MPDMKKPSLNRFQVIFGIIAELNNLRPGENIPINDFYVGLSRLRDKFPELLDQFDFEDCGSSTHSRELEDVLNKMSVWGCISIANPGYKYISFQATERAIKKLYDDKLDSVNKTQVRSIAELLSKVFSPI